MAEVKITRPQFPILFGGLGFHNSEALFYRLMEKEHFDQKIAKCYREIQPGFMRTFAGYDDWTRDSMDTFADYYEKMQKATDTPIYLAAAMGKIHFSDEERWQYAKDVAEKLDYLINVRNVKQIRYYCYSNEFSCGTHGVLKNDLPLFKKYHEYLFRAFQQRKLNIGLLATDATGVEWWHTLDYAIKEMAPITEDMCVHLYVSQFGIYDLDFYDWFLKICREYVMKCIRCNGAAGKRLILGEFGVKSGEGLNDPKESSYYFFPGVIKDVTNFNYTGEGAYAALMYAESAIAAINAGVLSLVYWTFSDYPDPYVCHYAENDEYAAEWGKCEKFISGTQDTKYNKCGLIKWEDDGDYSVRDMYWCIGLLTRYMKRNSKVLDIENNDPMLRMTALLHKDGSVSIAVVNRAKEKKQLNLNLSFKHAEDLAPFRVYEYDSRNVPSNEFGDLQDHTGTVSLDENLALTYELLPESLTILTTDYVDRPDIYAEKVKLSSDKKTLSWAPVTDKLHCYYRVYRGTTADFVPSKENQIASTVATDLKLDARYLKESAIRNVKGNYYKVISINKRR
ncbi:MAG: hypothetical protein E7656_03680 [Ruminococcaceae bacterium]|nr:hypothetical protein [Oscillospiraceae bacterium]